MSESEEHRTQRIEFYKEGNRLLGKGDVDGAIAAFGKALELQPEWTDCMLALATAYSNKGDQDKAIEIGKAIAKLDKDDAFVHTSLSIFYQRKGSIEEAEKEAAKARMISWKEELKTNPNAPPPADPGGMNVVQ